MSKIVLVAGLARTVPIIAEATYVGIDRGALICVQQNIPMKCAIGDFDSVNSLELKQIQEATKIEHLPAHKNETDSEVGIHYALEHGYDEIILFGALGGRIDHELANLYLMMQRDLPITIMNEDNCIQVIKEGCYKVEKNYTYLSFLALEESCISEQGVAYELDKQVLTTSDIYAVSNEITAEYATITLHYGRMLMMQTNDKQKT